MDHPPRQTCLLPVRPQANTCPPPCVPVPVPGAALGTACSVRGVFSVYIYIYCAPTVIYREDLPTLRVTNVSEDTTDNDLRELFSNFGRVARVYIGRDRETGIGKGYAFVSFEDRAVAQRAMEKVHGMGKEGLPLCLV